MKIEVHVSLDVDYVRSVIAGCHSRYWASDLEFNRRSPDLGFSIIEHNDTRDVTQHVTHVRNHEQVLAGLAKLAKIAPAQFGAMLAGNDDGITGDCLVQAIVFGELKYG